MIGMYCNKYKNGGICVMILQYEDIHKERELDEVELQHMGHQLVSLVNYYRMFIPVDDVDVDKRLNVLKYIGECIIHKEYYKLVNDPKCVIGNDNDISLEEYRRSMYELMMDQMFHGKPF